VPPEPVVPPELGAPPELVAPPVPVAPPVLALEVPPEPTLPPLDCVPPFAPVDPPLPPPGFGAGVGSHPANARTTSVLAKTNRDSFTACFMGRGPSRLEWQRASLYLTGLRERQGQGLPCKLVIQCARLRQNFTTLYRNPGRVGCALGTRHSPCHPGASRGLAKPSRDGSRRAKLGGSPRD
jgi:hypothetical protein